MRSNPLMTIREIAMRRGFVFIVASVLLGLVLAGFVMMSPAVALVVLLCGIVSVVTVLLRRIDYLLYAWFVLTSLIWFVMLRTLPPPYYQFAGRGIFWGLLVCAIAAWAMDNILSGRRFMPFDNMPQKAIILIFVLWGTMALPASVDVLNSVKRWSHIIIGFVVSYMFYDFFSRDENNIKNTLKIVSLVVVSVSFMTIAIAASAVMRGLPIYKEIYLWFLNPNVLGSFLMICCPILVTSGFDFGSIRRLKLFFVSVVFLALFISSSRSSWLAVLVSMIFLLWQGRTKLSLAPVIIVVLVVVGTTFPFWGGGFYDYITGERYTGRQGIWQGAWSAACDYPLFGIGIGNSIMVVPQYIDSPYLEKHFLNTHNLYLQNAVEMGFGSLVILLAFYVIFLQSSEKIRKNLKSHYLRSAVRGAQATFLGLLVHGMFESGSFLTDFGAAEFTVMFPYILIALPFAAKKLEERAETG